MKKRRLLGVLGALLLMAFPQVAEGQARYKIGVCDWMVLKRQKPDNWVATEWNSTWARWAPALCLRMRFATMP